MIAVYAVLGVLALVYVLPLVNGLWYGAWCEGCGHRQSACSCAATLPEEPEPQ